MIALDTLAKMNVRLHCQQDAMNDDSAWRMQHAPSPIEQHENASGDGEMSDCMGLKEASAEAIKITMNIMRFEPFRLTEIMIVVCFPLL